MLGSLHAVGAACELKDEAPFVESVTALLGATWAELLPKGCLRVRVVHSVYFRAVLL